MDRKRGTKQPPGTERFRDEQRRVHGPAYGGEDWRSADARGTARFGKARNDDAEPLEQVKPGDGDNTDDESPAAADPVVADAEEGREIESSGQRAGMGRGEAPRKVKSRSR